MHVSLDSALGRQRRLNSVGESVLQIAPNAAAAYSLRSLTGGDPTVVRVRRGSDNHEQDFTASEVSAGALTSFVNAPVIAPLDIQALEADGRTGDFLIAKAAYSLRSLGTRQATLAATGDTVARADGKFVCQVRRASDDTIKSFTADEVTDGTLVSFVTESFQKTLSALPFSEGSTWDVTVVDNSNYTFDCNNNTSTVGCRLISSNLPAGTKYRADFDFTTNSGDASNLKLNRSSPFLLENIVEGSNSIEFDFTADTILQFRVGAGSNVFNATISNLTVTAIGNDGHVKTWYDQSVTNQAGDTATGNHATQATAASQPKIVSAGSLLNELDFDGTDDFLDIGGTGTNPLGIGATDPLSIYTVQIASANAILGDDSNRHLRFQPTAIQYYLSTNVINESYGSTVSSTEFSLFSTNFGGTGATSLVQGHANGVAASTSDAQQGTSGANTAASPIEFIGARGSGTRSLLFDKSVKEIIIYVSDQTDNRTAIEANIGEVYSIDLPSGVDPGFDQVDGFVETWYDQSGNGKDATQATAGSQPKIVNAGVLLSELDFDGTDDIGLVTGSFSLTQTFSTFSVSHSDDASTSQGIWSTAASATDNFNVVQFFRSDDGFAVNAGNTLTTAGTINYVADRNYLQTNVVSGGSSSIFVDGATGATGNMGSTNPSGVLILGYFRSGGNNLNLDGGIKELIIYDTDQSSNRVALETNINSQYSIF